MTAGTTKRMWYCVRISNWQQVRITEVWYGYEPSQRTQIFPSICTIILIPCMNPHSSHSTPRWTREQWMIVDDLEIADAHDYSDRGLAVRDLGSHSSIIRSRSEASPSLPVQALSAPLLLLFHGAPANQLRLGMFRGGQMQRHASAPAPDPGPQAPE